MSWLASHLPYPLPAVLGHEAAGIIESVGSGVAGLSVGDHVIACLTQHCGTCHWCQRGKTWICEQRSNASVRPADQPRLSADGGAPIGLNVIQGAALAGAGRIIAVDLQSSKLELAQRFGATDTVLASEGDAVEAVKALTGGRGVDNAFEAIGLKATAEQALAMASSGGGAYLIGVLPAGANVEVPASSFTLTGKRLHGVRMGASNSAADFPRFVEMYQQGRLLLDELVAERITLDQVNDGYETMRQGEQARSVIVFD